jgi:hypothetical protein
MISNIDISTRATDIAKLFWEKNLGQVESITMVPTFEEDKFSQIAYVDVKVWFNVDLAYNFVIEPKNTLATSGLSLYINEKLSWLIRLNTHNKGNLQMNTYTIHFPDHYFKNSFELSKYKYITA